jgi:hypothetical protein
MMKKNSDDDDGSESAEQAVDKDLADAFAIISFGTKSN